MVKKRKIRCPQCGFLDTIKKGKRDGYSRYFCKNCKSYFKNSLKFLILFSLVRKATKRFFGFGRPYRI